MQITQQCIKLDLQSNHQRLKSKSKAAHQKVDQQLIAFIKQRRHQPRQTYRLFLNLMLQFWDYTFCSTQWYGRDRLLKDLSFLPSPSESTERDYFSPVQPNNPQSSKLVFLGQAYLFWGSAMGSKPLKALFSKMLSPAEYHSRKTEDTPFFYFNILISEHAQHWGSILSDIEQIDSKELDRLICLVNHHFQQFARLISTASEYNASQPPQIFNGKREDYGER